MAVVLIIDDSPTELHLNMCITLIDMTGQMGMIKFPNKRRVEVFTNNDCGNNGKLLPWQKYYISLFVLLMIYIPSRTHNIYKCN